MKKFIFLICLIILTGSITQAQCPGCLINTGCVVTPAAPTLCPSVLPDGTTGLFYDQDLTFYMPAQFTVQGFNVTLNQITIDNIAGLPAGLNWQTSSPSNIFYPSQNPPTSEHGCVKICGTPQQIGNYNVLVNITADVATPIGNITQAESFAIPITIVAPPGGNGTFTYNPSVGCAPLDVSFQAILTPLPAEIITYDWNFDNGNTSSSSNPATQTYALADTYYVSLNTKKYSYILTDVNVNLTGSSWGTDIDEGFFGLLNPDPYFEFSSGGSTQSVASVTDVLTASWNSLNYAITDSVFTLQFFDEDVITASDDLGLLSFNLNGPGTFNFSNSEVSGTYVIDTVLSGNFTDIDTVVVFPSPAVPVLNPSGVIQICQGLDVLLTTGSSGNLQWFLNDTTLLIGETNDTLLINQSGVYTVLSTNSLGCYTESNGTELIVNPLPVLPSMTLQGGLITSSSTDSLQWGFNGSPIAGANGTSIAYQDTGMYSLVAYNSFGCSTANFLYVNTPSGISLNRNSALFRLYPNPTNGLLRIDLSQSNPDNEIIITDIQGTIVYHEVNTLISGTNDIKLDFLANGSYLTQIRLGSQFSQQLIQVLK